MILPQTRRKIFRIIPFGLIWFAFSMVYTILERGIIGRLNHYPATGNPYSFTSNLVVTPVIALLFGLLIGAIEIFYLNNLFMRRSFTEKLLYKSLIYLFVIIFSLVCITVIANATGMHQSVLSKQVRDNVRAFFLDYAFLSVGIYMTSIVFVSQFYNEVSENMGHAVLMNFFTGKYHRPREEERIFMFLDMSSSTTIAESLGHLRYFDMLKEYYTDLSAPILEYSGEIYQYVGDEIVVSWKMKNGIDKNNCIRCFFAMQAAVKKQAPTYLEKFGVLPGFRAGFHFGKVTTGEIGALRKEIIFTGDVLNTTSRIQGLCRDHGVDLLVSEALLSKLSIGPEFLVTPVGEQQLRGRDEKIRLFTISA